MISETLTLFMILSFNGNMISVYESSDIENDCNHMRVIGCVTDDGIIIKEGKVFWPAVSGGTILEHELCHTMGLVESEIRDCSIGGR